MLLLHKFAHDATTNECVRIFLELTSTLKDTRGTLVILKGDKVQKDRFCFATDML